MKTKLVEWAARWFLGGIFRNVAEGKKGERLKAAYWWLVGKKRTWAAVLGLAFAALVKWQPETAARVQDPMLLVIGLLVAWGFVDAQWREAGPLPEWTPIIAKLLAAGPAAAALVALGVEVLRTMPDTCSWCDPVAGKVETLAAAVAAATAWLAARATPPPEVAFARRVTDVNRAK